MQLSPDESKILARCDSLLALEQSEGWQELRSVMQARIQSIDEKIAIHIEESYAPNKDYVTALTQTKHEKQLLLIELEDLFNKARSERQRIADEIAQYPMEEM